MGMMKRERVQGQFATKNGEIITLRSPAWEDLDIALEFINSLVSEKLAEPGFGIITDQMQTRESEAKWLANQLTEIEAGNVIHVSAFANGKLIGNCTVTRGKTTDEFHHGTLGISVSKEYRDKGIGRELLKKALSECKENDFKTVELEAFANNERAIHLYESVGFEIVGTIPKKMYRAGNFYGAVVMSVVL